MTTFVRGDVLARDGARAVVWTVSPLAVIPIVRRPDVRLAHDVPIDLFGDRMTCQTDDGAVIRVAGLTASATDRQLRVGRLSTPLLAQVELTVVRAHREAAVHQRWHDERQQRMDRLAEQHPLRGL